MPGSVLATEVDAGAAVAKGDYCLMILEAMMEHRIVAPQMAVEHVHVGVGDQVDNAQLLVTLAEKRNDHEHYRSNPL